MLDSSLTSEAKEQRKPVLSGEELFEKLRHLCFKSQKLPCCPNLQADLIFEWGDFRTHLEMFRIELQQEHYECARDIADYLLLTHNDNRETRPLLCMRAYDTFQSLLFRNRAKAEELASKFDDLDWRYWLLPQK
ncbi:hypothetical protein FJZ17_02925 [Candidatus Pacearchaeota archaeon]|nr:hypothetical protein [Candidatus Pacearchaeota archaeon]